MTIRRTAIAFTLAGLLVMTAGSAQAERGALDPGFGTGGKVTTEIAVNSQIYGAALQPDGKIVAVGYAYVGSVYAFTLARYNPNGSLDTSFNGTGKVTTTFGGTAYALACALQPDGKILAAGFAYNGATPQFALARYNPDGSLDTSFNGTGKVMTAIGSTNDQVNGIALQPDGKIVAAGWSRTGTNDYFALARYNPNGSLDTSFNGTGKVTTAIGTMRDVAHGVVLQPDGKIVAAGSTATATFHEWALARYNPNGSLDTSFNGTGKVTTAIGSGSAVAYALSRQPDGKIVVAGRSFNGANEDFALVRYSPDGSLDTSFNATGKVSTAIGQADDNAFAVALQPDGRIVAAGSSYTGANDDFALVHYNPDGTLDSTFGTGGKVTTAIGSAGDVIHAIALQGDGKIVAAGLAESGTDDVFALSRYQGSTLMVTRAGAGAGTVTSAPAGIDCGTSCSAPMAAVPVTLTATPAAGSAFTGWSGDCSGKGVCTLTMSADHSVAATFARRCIVPKLKGKTLAAAKKAIKRANCSVGKVTKRFSAKVRKGRVISSKPKAGAKLAPRAKVKLVVSKGRKRR